MGSEVNKTPDDVGPTAPRDLYSTSDIRFVMVELGKLQSKIDALGDDNKTHKSDFRLTLSGIIAVFLLLGGMLMWGYLRLEDKFVDLNRSVTVIGTKLDDIMQRPSFAPQQRR